MQPVNHQTAKLTFSHVDLRVVNIPLRRPIVSNPTVGQYTHWPYVLIDLKTHEGITGRAYIEPYVLNSTHYILPIIQSLSQTFSNKPIAPLDLYKLGIQSINLSGREGLGLVALSALDMAIWDAFAKASNQPLAELLGASIGPVKAYNTNGLWLKNKEYLHDEAISLVEEGNFSAIKMRMGRPNFKDDIAALDTVRDAIGAHIGIMVDWNQALNMSDALLRLHTLDNEGLQWFEEPIVYDNLKACAQLTRELKTPIQIGENIYGPRAFYNAVQMQAADLYMPDLMRIGGVTGFIQCSKIAASAGIPLSSHLYPEVSAHLLRASESAHWLEWRDWANPILNEPFIVKDGAIQIPNKPGCGIEWNEVAIKSMLVYSSVK